MIQLDHNEHACKTQAVQMVRWWSGDEKCCYKTYAPHIVVWHILLALIISINNILTNISCYELKVTDEHQVHYFVIIHLD